jgi:hypothetical protein
VRLGDILILILERKISFISLRVSDQGKLTFWDVLESISSKPIPKLPDNYSDIKDFVTIW